MSLRNYLDKIKPSFEEGGKLHAFRSVFDGFETFLYVPNTTSKSGTHIHDAIDSKRIMSMVVIALIPAMLMGMYNVGYQNYLAAGTLDQAGFFNVFFYGFLAVLPKISRIGYYHPTDCACQLSTLDTCDRMRFRSDLRKGDFWRYRNEYF